MGAHIDNVLMQQSTGNKSNMPSARPVAELLVALNEFNKYELYTGTGTGVQPLFSDGTGSSNVSFTLNQDNANTINGKFVYFDNTTNTWKPAYAYANPVANEHFTAQGFAISSNTSDTQITTSGKLIIPFRLKDYLGNNVVAGSYYYLCQDQANAGMIQQAAPANGIMQIVCQVIAADDTSTTLLLLNDLNQVADDIIQTDGDGSKYLGDDGQYHNIQVAGLAGRTANCINEYEVLDIDFENIATGTTNNTPFIYPALTTNGTWADNTNTNSVFLSTGPGDTTTTFPDFWKVTTGQDVVFTRTSVSPGYLSLRFNSVTNYSLLGFKITNHSDPAMANANIKSGYLGYFDGSTFIRTNIKIENPTNEPGATSIIWLPIEDIIQLQNGSAHTHFEFNSADTFDPESPVLAANLIQPIGVVGVVTNDSKGYIAIGDVTIENHIASNFSSNNYIMSKYIVENETQYSLRVKQTFTSVANEPIWSAPNSNNYLALDNGSLKLTLNGLAFKSSIVHEAGTYIFKTTYNKDTGYLVQSSTDSRSWTNEILISDEFNYLDKLSVYLGIVRHEKIATATTGSIDLSESGFDYKNNTAVIGNYPLSNLINKNVATITVTAKATGLIAAGRSNATGTLQATSKDIDITKNAIIASDKDTLVWDARNGLTMANYEEVDYLKQYEDQDNDTILYAKDTNYCYKYTIVYPNFLETGIVPTKDTQNYQLNCELFGDRLITTEDSQNHIIVSGFTINDFIRSNATIDYSKPWEWHTKVNISSDSRQSIFNVEVMQCDQGNKCFAVYTQATTRKLQFYASSTGESYDIAQDLTSTKALPSTGTHHIRVSWSGTQYLVDVSTNNSAWTNYITLDSTTPINSYPIVFGSNQSATYLSGSIDLSETYAMSDNQKVWEAILPNPTVNDYKIDFIADNASFHPNTFLNRNGFNFSLNIDLTGNLKVDRTWSAINYGGKSDTYFNIQGCDWSTFINDGGYTQGIKLSSYLGTNNIGTGANSLNKLTTNDNTYWWMTNQAQNIPAIAYFAFEKPINFSSILIRNAGSANYMPQIYAIHVSNDMNNWYNVIPETQTGFVKNGMFGNLPIDAYATWPSTTVNAFINQPCVMPNKNEYYKYVRLCLYQTTTYHPEISGFWIGSLNLNNVISTSGMRELILEKTDFINSGTSGINASVVRKKVGEAYQVKFLDRIGWTQVSPEEAVVNSEGKKLVPNEELIYHDPYGKEQIAQQILAYQTHCKQYLSEVSAQSDNIATNPFMNITSGSVSFHGCANTGTVANSYHLLQQTSTGYNFNNGLNESEFIITMTCRTRVRLFKIQNIATVGYNPQQIRIYGSIDGGAVAGTVSADTAAPITPAEEAIWEEIPIENVYPEYCDATGPDSERYKASNVLSFVKTANTSNPSISTTGDSAISFISITPKKAYLQYKIVVQRTLNNTVQLLQIRPVEFYLDPWAMLKDENGEPLPLPAPRPFYLSSTATTLPSKTDNITNGLYTSPDSPTTVWQLYQGGNNANWTPGNGRKFVQLQQVYKYPICFNSLQIQHGNDLNYAANLMESYGTNLTEYATQALSNSNSLKNWTRLVSLNEKCDSPTALSVAQKVNYINMPKVKYGYTYFTHLFARTLNNSIYMDSLMPSMRAAADWINNATKNIWSYYTQEWKWTNVPGIAGQVRNGACYNHPLLQTGDYESLTPSYAVTKRGEDYTYYTETQGNAGDYLPNGTGVYNNTSRVLGKTLPFENRWMYKYVDLDGNSWYSPIGPNDSVEKQYMYKNIIPWFNKEVYTGIPLTATANTGSANGFTYFANVAKNDSATNGYAWMAFSATSNSSVITWDSGDNIYNATTGLPTGDAAYIGFISPKPITVNGYTISLTNNNKATASNGLDQWEFQASNDGQTWITLDSRDTAKSENPDAPVNRFGGTSYYFENETAYTQFRWVINKVTPGATFAGLACQGLFVLEENPFEVRPIYELTYTNSNNVTENAYISIPGTSGEYVDNNIIIYKDLKFSEPVDNEWAYAATYGENTFYTKVAGAQGTYVPENTVLYTDKDFINAFETPAKVDTWEYTGVIKKKFSYTGEKITDFVWDGEEPYNKYFYTGEIANQYKYTGEIEGWQYTGVKEDLYDTVPNFKLTLNRDNARKIIKQIYIGPAYPVVTSEDLTQTNYYSFTSGDIAGTIVPEGTPLYVNMTDTISSVIADGTDSYVFGSAPMQTRYDTEYLYVANNDEPIGFTVTAGTPAFTDANLTQPSSDDVTQYTYTNVSEPSKMTEFYHRITEFVPTNDYNFSLSFDGQNYTFNSYANGASSDIQTFESTELVKSSYDGNDEEHKKRSVILMKSQNMLKLNLSKSDYSWWEWNGVVAPESSNMIAQIFRLAKVDWVDASIEDIYKLYPWRVDDSTSTRAVSIPVIDATNGLLNEIKIENVYVVSNINTLANDPNIPKNTLILGYGGYL